MLTAAAFRRLALAFDEAVEQAHMGHPDFRRHGRIFATLGYPDAGHGMVRLSAADQDALVTAYPAAFTPAAGAWGAGGATIVRLSKAPVSVVRTAMDAAWRLAEGRTRGAKARTAAKAATSSKTAPRTTQSPRRGRAPSRAPRVRR